MNLKRLTVIGTACIFLLSFVINRIYDLYPSMVTYMFFPASNSIWEHQKMICLAYLIWGVIEYFLLKLFRLYSRNIVTSVVLSSVCNIIIFLLLYMPLYAAFGHSSFIYQAVFILSVVISQSISYSILNSDNYYKYLNVI